MRLLVAASVVKATKKLHPSQITELNTAIEVIASSPSAGDSKAGDLQGVRVYKFKLSQQLCLLAYRIVDEESIKLLTFGLHDNDYRDLER